MLCPYIYVGYSCSTDYYFETIHCRPMHTQTAPLHQCMTVYRNVSVSVRIGVIVFVSIPIDVWVFCVRRTQSIATGLPAHTNFNRFYFYIFSFSFVLYNFEHTFLYNNGLWSVERQDDRVFAKIALVFWKNSCTNHWKHSRVPYWCDWVCRTIDCSSWNHSNRWQNWHQSACVKWTRKLNWKIH